MTDTAANALSDLGEACFNWQGGRDLGSSLLRGAARVETGLPHYFKALYIDKYEADARANPAAMANARILLDALAEAPHRTADEWCTEVGLASTGFAGRGLARKPGEHDQIAEALDTGQIAMPLWGVSLSPTVADSFGNNDLRWIFEIVGPFPAIAAWTYSQIKPEEQELICGGRYSVASTSAEDGFTRVRLTYEGPATRES